MKMFLKSTDSELDYMGFNEKGHGISINGEGEGVSPMQTVLLAIAACSAVDVEIFLKKMRQNLHNIEVEIEGQRREEPLPKVFTDIHVSYKLYGDIKLNSAKKAVDMAIIKYCSVSTMLQKSVNITHDFVIIKQKKLIEEDEI
jgi:putative redox protein